MDNAITQSHQNYQICDIEFKTETIIEKEHNDVDNITYFKNMFGDLYNDFFGKKIEDKKKVIFFEED